MKGSLLLYVFLTASLATWGQARLDSMQQSAQIELDSPQKKIVPLPDTLLPAYQKVDSIRTSFNQEADSLQMQYRTALSKLDGATTKINYRIDSLGNLNQSTSAVRGALDSLNQLRLQTQKKFSVRLGELKSKTTGKLNALDPFPQSTRNPYKLLQEKLKE